MTQTAGMLNEVKIEIDFNRERFAVASKRSQSEQLASARIKFVDIKFISICLLVEKDNKNVE